jgi:sorting nexin-9/18/33
VKAVKVCSLVKSLSYRLHSPVDCLKLTRALQKTSETLQSVADLFDDHVCRTYLEHLDEVLTACQARRTQLATHEVLKTVAHPSQLYAVHSSLVSELTSLIHAFQPIIDTHRNALLRYTEATEGSMARRPPTHSCQIIADPLFHNSPMRKLRRGVKRF